MANMQTLVADAEKYMNQFLQLYYSTFQTERPNLASCFDDTVSIFAFEGTTLVGKEEIMKKLISLPFKSLEFSITTADSQPTTDGGYFSMVVGQLKTDDDPPHGFSQSFHVKKSPTSGNPIVLNSSFRLSLHHH